jgi:hypothetical protein
LRDEARAAGKYDAAISAEHKRGLALGYYIERRESGAARAFQAKTREEVDRVLEETIGKIAALQGRKGEHRTNGFRGGLVFMITAFAVLEHAYPTHRFLPPSMASWSCLNVQQFRVALSRKNSTCRGHRSIAEHCIKIHPHPRCPYPSMSQRVPSMASTAYPWFLHCSAKPLLERTVVLGEMSVQGMLLKVNALPERMQLAVEAGAKRILIPSENKRDLAEVPDAVLTAIQWQFYDSPTKAAIMGMGLI